MTQSIAAGAAPQAPAHVRHARLVAWVAEIAALTQARDVYWCDGTKRNTTACVVNWWPPAR